MSELVLREDREGLAILTLNRPEALNALSPSLFVELRRHVDDIAQDVDNVGCVLLRGEGRSKELMYSGRVIDGEEAAAIGLAVRCVPDEELLEAAVAMARTFLENSWFTLRADKMLVNGGLNHTLADGLAFERSNSPGRGPDLEERLERFGK